MNTIEEILKSKKRTLSAETIFDTYKRDLCSRCSNRGNKKDLCRITVTRDQKAKCDSYDRCMKNKCKTCKDESKCFEKESEYYVSKSDG